MNINATQLIKEIEVDLDNFESRLNDPSADIQESDFQTVDLFSYSILSLRSTNPKKEVLSDLEARVEYITNSLIDRIGKSGKDEKKSASSSSKVPAFPAERITQLPSNDAFLKRAIERLMRFTKIQKQLERVCKQNIQTAQEPEKTTLKQSYALKTERIRQQNPKRIVQITRAKLQKKEITTQEAADASGTTMSTFRARKIQAAIAKCLAFDKEDVAFDKKVIAKELGIDENVLNEWLIASEKEVWLNSLLTELGGDIVQTKIIISMSTLKPYLDDLAVFFAEVQKNIPNFNKPLQVVKMQNILRNIDLIQCDVPAALEPFKKTARSLLGQMIDELKGRRRSALAFVAQTQASSKELRDLIAAKTFKLAQTTPKFFGLTTTLSLTEAPGIHPQEYIAKVKRKAEETVKIVRSIINYPLQYDAQKAKLPESAVQFCEYNRANLVPALKLIQSKLEAMITRQNKRLQMMALGFIFEPPIYFHGTPTMEAAFSIATTGIRPAHGKAFYGAFHSTYPAMLVYGNIIVGLGQRVAFNGNIGSAVGQGWFSSYNQSLFMPDLRSDAATYLFRHQTKEKWIGLDDLTTINPKVTHLKGRFYEAFSQALFASYKTFCMQRGMQPSEEQFAPFEGELLASLERYHLTLTFQENYLDASKGTWNVQIENILSARRGQFVSLDAHQLIQHLLKLESLSDFRSYMQPHAQKFLQEIYTLLHPPQKDPLSYFSRLTCSKTLNNILHAVAKFLYSHVESAPLAIQSSRDMPLTAHMITIDEEPLLDTYFQDPKWQRSSVVRYSQAQARAAYMRALGGNIYAQDANGARQKAIRELFCDTHMITLMEQLMEFDFTTEDGVRVLNEWVKQ